MTNFTMVKESIHNIDTVSTRKGGDDDNKDLDDTDDYFKVSMHDKNFDDEEENDASTSDKQNYHSKWASSQLNLNEMNDTSRQESNYSFNEDDELPIFADEECKRIHKLTKQLERERDAATKKVKENKDRISIMQEHLHNVRQEIDHTNALVAAKNNEIATEKHLIALVERDLAITNSDIKILDTAITNGKERLRSIQNEIHAVTDEREKLKLDLNWNQEELEQWATAATKKESDTLALQKYTRADEMLIKELTLKLENMTKRSLEKKAQLENEITETKAKQLEVDRLANTFRSQHEERRLLVQQWQETVNAMKDRDRDINELSRKYTNVQQDIDNQLTILSEKKETLDLLKSENESLLQEIESSERVVQTKRQERLNSQLNLQAFKDELETIKLENITSLASVEEKKTLLLLAEAEAEEKSKQLHLFKARHTEIKKRFEDETKETLSQEKLTRSIEERLKKKDKELKMKENLTQTMKQQMFKDSQMVAQLRQQESKLITEIRSTETTSKNLSAKISQLDLERSRQQELLYNAEFQLQQMERKVARGLGERSDEEKKQLQMQIDELEVEHNQLKDRQATLLKQSKKLQQEVQQWQKKRKQCQKDQIELNEKILNTELEISACELNLKKLVIEKEEEMVSHDLVRLEVRRLRDILRLKLEEVIELENNRDNLLNNMSAKKTEMNIQTEVQTAQLRAIEDERHRSAVELGQRKIVAEKMQFKHEALTKAHGNDGNGETSNSPLYHLITAAQRRAELQREGDLLDSEIRRREKELKSMEKTLSHLRGRNTDFRSSFAKVNKSSKEYQDVIVLDEEVKSSETTLLEAKKEFQLSKRRNVKNQKQIEALHKTLDLLKKECKSLEETNSEVMNDIDKLERGMKEDKIKIKEQRKRDIPHIPLKENEESLQEILFRAEISEIHIHQITQMLVEIAQEFPDMCLSIMQSLSQERIEVNF